MNSEREKKQSAIVETVKDVAAEALRSAGQAAAVVVATRAAQGIQVMAEEAEMPTSQKRARSRKTGKRKRPAKNKRSARKRTSVKRAISERRKKVARAKNSKRSKKKRA